MNNFKFILFYSRLILVFMAWYLVFLLDCLGRFELAISGGYFKKGYIDKGKMSSKSECACACDKKTDCVVFGFRDDNQKCYFYVDVSDLTEQVVDVAANNYIKNIPGNNSLLTYTLLKIIVFIPK